jgi:hypothetical protein
MVAGNLRDTLVLITRNGKAGDMQTTYSMDILPAEHPVFKPEMIPNDFSAFNNFNIARHSYWEKSADEIQAYLTTGQFPEKAQTNTQQAVNYTTLNGTGGYAVAQPSTAPQALVGTPLPATAPTVVESVTTAPAYVAPAPAAVPPATPVYSADPNANTAAPNTGTAPTRNFTGFSF